MIMSSKEQALIATALDAYITGNVFHNHATQELWCDIYDSVIGAEITDDEEWDDVEWDDFLADMGEDELNAIFEKETNAIFDTECVDQHMTALSDEELSSDEKTTIAESFVNMMDSETADHIFQAIANRWQKEAEQRFHDITTGKISA